MNGPKKSKRLIIWNGWVRCLETGPRTTFIYVGYTTHLGLLY